MDFVNEIEAIAKEPVDIRGAKVNQFHLPVIFNFSDSISNKIQKQTVELETILSDKWELVAYPSSCTGCTRYAKFLYQYLIW